MDVPLHLTSPMTCRSTQWTFSVAFVPDIERGIQIF